MAEKKDPTITSAKTDPPAGSHPAVPIEEGANSATELRYAEHPDKPGPSTVAQIEVAQ